MLLGLFVVCLFLCAVVLSIEILHITAQTLVKILCLRGELPESRGGSPQTIRTWKIPDE